MYNIVLKPRTISNSPENPTCWLLNEGTGHRDLSKYGHSDSLFWASRVVYRALGQVGALRKLHVVRSRCIFRKPLI